MTETLTIPDPVAVKTAKKTAVASPALAPPVEVTARDEEKAIAGLPPSRVSTVERVDDLIPQDAPFNASLVSPLGRVGNENVPYYTKEGQVKLIPLQNLRSAIGNEMTRLCPLCGGHHLEVDKRGKTVFDTRPDACPKVANLPKARCPFCRKTVYGISGALVDAPEVDDDDSYIKLDLLGDGSDDSLVENKVLIHCIAYHPQESLQLKNLPDHVKTQLTARFQGGRI